jgi:hypothetical protein
VVVFSRHEAVLLLALGLAGCSVGGGEGEINGSAVATDFCGLDNADYQLVPSFFSAELVEGSMSLRVQRGSELEQFADGLMILVRDVNDIKQARIGLPVRLDGDWLSPVQMTFYLNDSCPAGFPSDHRRRAVMMEAVGGTITFNEIYAPDLEPRAPGIEAGRAFRRNRRLALHGHLGDHRGGFRQADEIGVSRLRSGGRGRGIRRTGRGGGKRQRQGDGAEPGGPHGARESHHRHLHPTRYGAKICFAWGRLHGPRL